MPKPDSLPSLGDIATIQSGTIPQRTEKTEWSMMNTRDMYRIVTLTPRGTKKEELAHWLWLHVARREREKNTANALAN